MTLQQLLYIVETSNEGSFYKAAEKCFVTQPTLSVQVKKLEDEIGIVIFKRNTKPLKITEQGKEIISKARAILDDMNSLENFAKKEHSSIAGDYKIGVIPTLSTYIFPILFKNFSKNYPDTNINIQEMKSKNLVKSLLSEEIDIGILVTPINEKTIREIPLFNERLLVYTSKSHQLYSANRIKIKDLTENGLLLLEEGNSLREQTLELCKISKLKENKLTYQCKNIETLLKIVDLNYAYTLVPELSLSNRKSDMVKEFEEPVPVREVSIVVKNNFPKEKLIQIISDHLIEELPSFVKKIDNYFRVNI